MKFAEHGPGSRGAWTRSRCQAFRPAPAAADCTRRPLARARPIRDRPQGTRPDGGARPCDPGPAAAVLCGDLDGPTPRATSPRAAPSLRRVMAMPDPYTMIADLNANCDALILVLLYHAW